MGQDRSANRQKGAKPSGDKKKKGGDKAEDKGATPEGALQGPDGPNTALATVDPAVGANVTSKMQKAGGNAATDAAVKGPARGPEVSASSLANMTKGVAEIVEALMDGALDPGEQSMVVYQIEAWRNVDLHNDLHPGMTPHLDRFLTLLGTKTFTRRDLTETVSCNALDELWSKLRGGELARFQAAVQLSRAHGGSGPTKGGGKTQTGFQAVVAPLLWQIAQLGSFGVVDPELFAAMEAAAAKGNEPGNSVIIETARGLLHTVGPDIINILTMGLAPAAGDAAAAYVRQHPNCTWHEVIGPALGGIVNAVLPLQEAVTVAKALKLIPVEANEIPPDFYEGLKAACEGFLKLVAIGAFLKAVRTKPKVAETAPNAGKAAAEAEAAKEAGGAKAKVKEEPGATKTEEPSTTKKDEPDSKKEDGKRKLDDEPDLSKPIVEGAGPVVSKMVRFAMEKGGMTQAAAEGVLRIAQGKYRIRFRPTNRDAAKFIEAGHSPKPEFLKMKTINKIDQEFLGATGERGLVGYFEPKKPAKAELAKLDPASADKVMKRYRERKLEFDVYAKDIKTLSSGSTPKVKVDNGTVIDLREGVGKGKAFTGDCDIFDVLGAAGGPLPPQIKAEVIEQLKGPPVNAQHGAHMDWQAKKAKDQKMKEDIIDNHRETTKSGEGGEALIEFGPDGVVKPTFAAPATPGPATIGGVDAAVVGAANADKKRKDKK